MLCPFSLDFIGGHCTILPYRLQAQTTCSQRDKYIYFGLIERQKTVDKRSLSEYNASVQAEAARFSHAAGIYAGDVKASK